MRVFSRQHPSPGRLAGWYCQHRVKDRANLRRLAFENGTPNHAARKSAIDSDSQTAAYAHFGHHRHSGQLAWLISGLIHMRLSPGRLNGNFIS